MPTQLRTKKMLIPVDLDNSNKKHRGFVYPNFDSGEINSFLVIGSDKVWEHAMVVYTGKSITKNDIFAKIVDSGKQIKSVKMVLEQLDNYLGQIKGFRIGDILGIKDSHDGFKLVKIEKSKAP
jgi:hypothetical protein